ncbi:MAG: 6,7-dimethyl-8-ribityllumazine synthase [Stellaceae bacterium]
MALAGHAIGFGVLTVENVDQAFARARIDEKNKGGEAACACLAMIALQRSLKGRR